MIETDYTFNPEAKVGVATTTLVVKCLANYVKDLGEHVPTLHNSPMLTLFKPGSFGLFLYAGSPLVPKVHFRTSLLHNTRSHTLAEYPTYCYISVNSLLKQMLSSDREESYQFPEDILCIVSPGPYLSRAVQDILARTINGRCVDGKITIMCTNTTLGWFPAIRDTNKDTPWSPDLKQLFEASDGVEVGGIDPEDVKNFNGYPKEGVR